MSAQYSMQFLFPLNPERLLTPALSSFGGGEGDGGRGFCEVRGLNVYAPPHPGLLPRGEGETLAPRGSFLTRGLIQSGDVRKSAGGPAHSRTLARVMRPTETQARADSEFLSVNIA